MSKTTSFFWFDYETFGTHPAWDRPCQFAGVRTDANLEVIAEPQVFYCRQSSDYLPHPAACRVTGITPQLANKEGLPEAEFIARIHQEMTFPGTCSVGYNNIRFDDEFTRHTLFRNLFDSYEQEWKDGCSRWDLLDIVRLTRALRPDGIQWPFNDDGSATNRLEHLSAANNIEHANAHDAMSDVWATLGMAKKIKQSQPRLFDYAFNNRSKQDVSNMLNTRDRQACLQVSGMIPATQQHISGVLPLIRHPQNTNSTLVLDLSVDSRYLAGLDSDEIARRLFTTNDERKEGDAPRPGLRTIQINKCPVLVPLATLRAQDIERLKVDVQAIKRHAAEVNEWLDESVLSNIVSAMTREWPEDADRDVDGTLYSGNFLSQADKQRLSQIKSEPAGSATVAKHCGHFDDKRLDELVRRYMARSYPDQLNTDDAKNWQEHCQLRLNDSTAPWLCFEEFNALMADDSAWQSHQNELRLALIEYGKDLQDKAGIC